MEMFCPGSLYLMISANRSRGTRQKDSRVIISSERRLGLRSEVQVTGECFVLDPCSCWRSSLAIGVRNHY